MPQNPIQDNSQPICKLGNTLAWADDDDFEDSTTHENVSGGKGLPDRCHKDKTKLTEGKLGGLTKLLKTFLGIHKNDEESQKDDNENSKNDKIRKITKDNSVLNLLC